jgi:hypothetical protein
MGYISIHLKVCRAGVHDSRKANDVLAHAVNVYRAPCECEAVSTRAHMQAYTYSDRHR